MYFPVGMEIKVTPNLLVVLPAGKTMVAAKLLCGCTNRPVGFKLISTWLTADIMVYDIATVVACYFIPFLYHNAFVLYDIFIESPLRLINCHYNPKESWFVGNEFVGALRLTHKNKFHPEPCISTLAGRSSALPVILECTTKVRRKWLQKL